MAVPPEGRPRQAGVYRTAAVESGIRARTPAASACSAVARRLRADTSRRPRADTLPDGLVPTLSPTASCRPLTWRRRSLIAWERKKGKRYKRRLGLLRCLGQQGYRYRDRETETDTETGRRTDGYRDAPRRHGEISQTGAMFPAMHSVELPPPHHASSPRPHRNEDIATETSPRRHRHHH